jgi:LPS-assembly protein
LRRASVPGSSGIVPAVLSTLLLLAVGLGAAPAMAARKAEEPPFTINADSIEYDSVASVYVARGNVRIHKEDETLTADWVMFSNVTREGLASGHVVHQDGPDRLTGEFLQFNIDTLKGFVREGVLTSDNTQYLTRADEVRKTGAATYDFKKVRFTTCQCPDGGDPSWELKADTASLDTEGYAVAKNTTFEMFGIPILWSPWAAYPVRRERSTGFLFPVLNNTNRSGFDPPRPERHPHAPVPPEARRQGGARRRVGAAARDPRRPLLHPHQRQRDQGPRPPAAHREAALGARLRAGLGAAGRRHRPHRREPDPRQPVPA